MSEETEAAPFVLVANDESACSQVAADAAVRLAEALEMAVRGIYVVDANLIMEPYLSLRAELGEDGDRMSRDDWMHRFEALGDHALADLKASCQAYERSFSGEVVFGGVNELILKEASRPAAHLLALGRRGRSTKGSDLGSHFADIAHHAQLPLLVGGAAEADLEQLLVVHDGSDHADEVCGMAGDLAEALSAELTVVGIGDPIEKSPRSWTTQARQALGSSGAKAVFIEADGKGGAAILSAADECQADLIVMSHFRHQEWVQRLVGSPVEHVLRNDDRLVLMV
ncbi:MAG: universal stress protein [Anaerolineales bacterium]